MNLTDGQTHDLELYFLDWDGTNRGEQVKISNAATGAVLDTETVSSFHSGVYLEWAVTGNVLITITKLSGANAVLSGLFFDPVTVSNDILVTSAVGDEFGAAWLVDANEVGTSSFGGNDSQVALIIQGNIPAAGVAVRVSAVPFDSWQPKRAHIAQSLVGQVATLELELWNRMRKGWHVVPLLIPKHSDTGMAARTI